MNEYTTKALYVQCEESDEGSFEVVELFSNSRSFDFKERTAWLRQATEGEIVGWVAADLARRREQGAWLPRGMQLYEELSEPIKEGPDELRYNVCFRQVKTYLAERLGVQGKARYFTRAFVPWEVPYE